MNINGIEMETDFLMLTDEKLTKFDLFTLVALHGLLSNPNRNSSAFADYAYSSVNYASYTLSEIDKHHQKADETKNQN